MLNEERKLCQRFLALLCSGAMLVGMLPIQAFAEEADPEKAAQAAPTKATISATPAPAEPKVQKQSPSAAANGLKGSEPDVTPQVAPATNGDGIKLNYTTLEMNLTDMQTVQLIATADSVMPEEAFVWSSSEETVASVVVDPEDSSHATVTAVGAGSATVTAKYGQKSVDCVVTVKSEATAVHIVSETLTQGITVNAVDFPDGIQLSAQTEPAQEYCTSDIAWSVTGENVSIDDTGLLTVGEISNDSEPIEVTVQAGTVTDTLTFTLAKKEDHVTLYDQTIYYGSSIQLSASSDNDLNLSFSLDDTAGNEAQAVVTPEGMVTVGNVGTFTVKAESEGNGYYQPGEASKTFTVLPKQLQVIFTEPEQQITKVSDGTTALDANGSKVNKEKLEAAFTVDPGQIAAGDRVSLQVDVSSAAYESTMVGKNRINLAGIQFSLAGTDSGKYALSEQQFQSCPAQITAIQPLPEEREILLNTSSDKSVQDGLVIFKAGQKGSNPDTEEYWYAGTGVPVTLDESCSLLQVKENGTAGDPVTRSGEDGATYFTAESGQAFYLCSQEIYYGPYTLVYNVDQNGPSIDLIRVVALKADGEEEESTSGVIFGRKAKYTIKVSDKNSGINQENVYYTISEDVPTSEDLTGWTRAQLEPAEDGGFTFTVNAPAVGTLYIRASDMVDNWGQAPFRTLVLEENAPVIKFSLDGTDLENKGTSSDVRTDYTLNVEVTDSEEGANKPSGIQRVTYSVLDQNGQSLKQDVLLENKTPENLGDITGSYLQYTENQTLSTLLGETQLDGEYTLVVTAVDFCGNSSTFSYTFQLDNTAPVISVQMNGGQSYQENGTTVFYYKADNCGIDVTFRDDNLSTSEDCRVTLSGAEAGEPLVKTVKASGTEATASFDKDEVVKLGDGVLTITVYACDTAGNVQQAIDPQTSTGITVENTTASFMLDTTAPLLTGIEAKNGNYYAQDNAVYYNAGFQIKFVVDESNYQKNLVKNLTSRKNDGPDSVLDATDPQNITVSVVGTAENAIYVPEIVLEDKAGNSLQISDSLKGSGQESVQVEDGKATLTTSFVLDTISPELVDVTTTAQGQDYPEAVYYQGAFDVTFVVEDANYDADSGKDRNYGKSVLTVSTDGGAAGKTSITDEAIQDQRFAKTLNIATAETAKTTYNVSLEVLDKAGNRMHVSENCLTKGPNQVSESENKASLKARIMDTTPPVAVIRYTDLEEDHFYQENAEKVATAYYNKDLSTSFEISDEGSLDETKLLFARTKEGEEDIPAQMLGTEQGADTTFKIFDETTIPSLKITANMDTHENDGTYVYTMYGTDKAGNPLTVVEEGYYSEATATDHRNCAEGCGDAEHAYVGAPKAMDTVAPTANISYTDLDNTHFYQDGSNVNAYYNKTFTATFAFGDTYGTEGKSYNLDEGKLHYDQLITNVQQNTLGTATDQATATASYTVQAREAVENDHYTFIAYGEDKAGNPLTVSEEDTEGTDILKTYTGCETPYESSYHKVMDTAAPVFTLDIRAPEDVSTAVDEQNRAYYNCNIEATFTIQDQNLDSKKVEAKAAEKQGQNFAYENEDVSWSEIALSKSDVAESEQTITKNVTIDRDGVYRIEIQGEDRAGNQLEKSLQEEKKTDYSATLPLGEGKYWTNIKIRDTVAPKLTVELSDSNVFYTAHLSNPQGSSVYNIETNLPYRKSNSATGKLIKEDCSPVSVKYNINSTTASQSQSGSPYNYETLGLNFTGEQIFFFETLEVRDRAGNVSVMPSKSNKIYLDMTAPEMDELAPTVSLVAHASGEGRGTAGTDLYDGNVTVRAQVTDPGDDVRSSGLYQVYYKVLVNGEHWEDKVGVNTSGSVTQPGIIWYGTGGEGYESSTGNDEALTRQDVIDFVFDATTFNYNDVKIFVWAEDNSGNMIEESQAAYYFFGIDITTPTIQVSYDNNDAQNEKYFKADRVATVTVTERNFDPSGTVITTESSDISGWTYTAGSLPNGDDDTWSCTVAYTQDGDYTFDVSTKDLLGHSADPADYGDSVAPREFTIDKTNPVIRISFNNNDVRNGKYYDASRVATVSIEEHNFWTEGVALTTTATIQEGSVTAPNAGSWTSSGDMNAATVSFDQDGNYSMHVEFTDLAGNEAEPEDVDEFVVDTTAPELEITGVEDQMAYNGDVAPTITYHDINYDPNSAGVSIEGVKHPEGENLNGTYTEDAFGGSFTCENIEPVKENDDVYTATGTVSDMAGNETEVRVMFSVNRFGSTYMIPEDTQTLLDNYYTNTPQDLHIIEINVDGQTSNRVTTSLNGEVTTLKQGTDYTVKESTPGWHEFDYTILASSFATEGAYDVTLYSEDEAGNTSSNRAIKEDSGNTSDLPINFVVDMTPPVNVITGVDNDEQYIAAERTIMVNYDDNIGMAGLTLYIDHEAVAEYDADDLKNAAGAIQYVAKADNHWQQFTVVSTDLAGNVSEESTVRYLLTGNLFIQYYNNKPIFYGSLAILAALILFLIAIVKRKKHQPVNKA